MPGLQGHHSAAGRIRTCDPRIKSPLLRQLSYGGESAMIAAERQWRKWRRLVNTMAAPASSTASTTS